MQTQKAQQKSGKPPKNGSAKVIQPHIHGSGFYRGSLHRRDKYEYQADEAARRILRGEEGIAKNLTPTLAASFRLSTSVGQPLPQDIRQDLETGFGADFSEVRIHNDTRANRMARSEDAKAFTSSSHIYFGEGMYQPATFVGRELLIHELTHVLQQTGRSSSEGKLRATQVTGEGEIQRFDFLAEAERYKVFNTVTWDEIKTAYKAVPNFNAHVNKIESMAIGLTYAEYEKVIDTEVSKPSFNSLSNEIKGLYIDTLKHMQHYEKAWQVLQKDTGIPTAFRDKSFYKYIRKKSLSWLPKVAKQNEYTKYYYPWRFVNAYHRFFLSPDGRPIDLGLPPETEALKRARALRKAAAQDKDDTKKDKNFSDAILSHLWSIRTSSKTKLMQNELHPIMLLAFYCLDDARKQVMPQELQMIRGRRESLITAIIKLSQHYVGGDLDTLAPETIKESKAIFSGVLRSIKKKAKKAVEFWKQAQAFKYAHYYKQNFKKLPKDEVKRIANGINTDRKFKRFPRVIIKTAKTIFARKGGNLPRAIQFAGKVKRRKSALVNVMASYVARISLLLLNGQSGSEQALRYGLAMVYLADVDTILHRYDAMRDKKLAAQSLDDERQALRIRLANKLIEIALLFDWNSLRLLSNSVFQEGYQLAILGGWEEDKNATLITMSKELGRTEIKGYKGTRISGHLLQVFLHTNYFNVLSAQLKVLLRVRKSDFSDKVPILCKAIKKANIDWIKPRRFLAIDWEYTSPDFARDPKGKPLKPGSKPTKTPPNLGDLIFAHKVTKKAMAEHQNELALVPSYYSRSDPLYMWFVPSYSTEEYETVVGRIQKTFIEFLSTIKQVADAVKVYWTGKKTTAKFPNPETDPWVRLFDDTIAALQKSKDPKDAETLKAIGKAIAGKVQSEAKTAEKTAKERMRKAVSHQRKVIIDNRLRPKLTNFDRHDRSQWNVPDKIFNEIEEFDNFVRPKEDKLLQVSTLILEIAYDLDKAFGPKTSILGTSHIRRFSIIDPLLTLIWGTLDYWNQRQKEARKAVRGMTLPSFLFNPIVTISTLSYSSLLLRVWNLQSLKKSLKKRVVAEQKRHGITAKKGTRKDDGTSEGGEITSVFWKKRGSTLITWAMERRGFSIRENQRFALYGNFYKLIHVHEDFSFHPGFGKRETLGITWPSKHRPGDPLLYFKRKQVTKPTGRKLITVLYSPAKGKGQEKIITDNDLHELLWFSTTFSEFLGFEYIKGAGNLLETMATIELEIAEWLLLRGAGKAARVAIILAAISRFIASTDFKKIKETIFINPKKVKDHLISILKEGAPGLISKLLFGKLPFESHLVAPDIEGKDKKKAKKKPKSKLGKFIKFVTERCEEALRAFVKLRGRVRGSFVKAQGNIVRQPPLLHLVEAIPILLRIAEEFPEFLDIAKALDLGNPGRIKGKLKEQIQDIVNSLVELEIPQDIISMDLAAEVLIEFAMGRFGAKGKALRKLLEVIKANTFIAERIAVKLNEGGLNPNLYWRNEVVNKIQPLLEKAQIDLYNKVKEIVSKATKNTIQLDKPRLKKSAVTIDTSKPQLEPFRDQSAKQEDSLDQVKAIDISDGAFLSQSLNHRFVAEFGHNFDHVRLHRGKFSHELTQAAGAQALTSGSHIFLNQGVNLDQNSGQKILRHELAHVLQQLGPRPRTLEYSRQPKLGSPGKGLSFNKEQEAAAKRMAKKAEAQEGNYDEPLTIETSGGQGFMPSLNMNAIALKVLDELTEEEIALDQAEAFEKKVPAKIERKATFASAKTKGELMWKSISSIVSGKRSNAVFSAPLHKAKDEIATLLSGSFNTKMNAAMSGIVLRSIQTLANGRIIFKPKLFTKNVETYIFARTGLVINIKTSRNRAKRVEIKYLHLAFLPGTTALWGAMKTNTTARLTAAQQKLFDINGWCRVRHIIEARLHEKQVWHKSKFRLGEKFIEEVAELLKTTKEVKIDTWDEYKNPKAVKSATAGLRVATHGELTGKAKQPDFSKPENMPASARKDRQSHHIPQYLLIEYFRGNNSTRLFANAEEHLSGFMPKGRHKRLAGFSLSDSNTSLTINFAKYDSTSGRSDKLPAISLAAITHQKGRLHINAASDWKLANETKGTQGKQVNAMFLKHLHEKTKVTGSKAEIKKKTVGMTAKQAEIKKKTVGMTAKQLTQFRENTYKAMKETYSSMYNYMIKALPTALVDYEIPYYKDIAMALKNVERDDDLKKPFNPTESPVSIKAAKAAIIEKNRTVMTDWR